MHKRTQSSPRALRQVSDEVAAHRPPLCHRGTRPLGAEKRERRLHSLKKHRERVPYTHEVRTGDEAVVADRRREAPLSNAGRTSAADTASAMEPVRGSRRKGASAQSTRPSLQTRGMQMARSFTAPSPPRPAGKGSKPSHPPRTILPRHHGRPRTKTELHRP
jgi:hypothetical protein